MNRHRCSLCSVIFTSAAFEAAFCTSCLSRMEADAAAARERRARIERGDLQLFNEGAVGDERIDILRARRNGNHFSA
jgi:hypothetical protein